MKIGMLLSDIPASTPPAQHFDDLLRVVEAAQRNGFSYIAIGQHFLYGDLRWLQPVPLLARLAAEVDRDTRLVTQIVIPTLYHPVILAEELATLDIVTEGRLIVGLGLGYRTEEFDYLGVPTSRRGARFDESIELMKALWTQEEVTFAGEFWQLEGARPHIQPVQQPHPPIWIGGHSSIGARRAGQYGDAYATPPETTREQITERFGIIKEEFASRGKPFGPQSLRRNVLIADTHEDAVVEYARVAKGRYITYAQRGLDLYTGEALEEDFERTIADHAVVGTPDEVVGELVDLVTSFPVDPLLVRPQWPTMSAEETIATIDTLGRHVVAALRDVEARQDL
jgi:alkanesulfonate monooxygenase SsuD/methylene tetrahydromethanopterin reductase-like flavin-dependent oxidoreductase (luciferase family)